ncbi:MAG: hypothetical protein ABSG90_02730 [Dehalococcoidia bacterium]|jgi:hypothetical protein
MAKVKCATCGYLGSRNSETRHLEETDYTTREKGIIPLYFREDKIYHPTHTVPFCSRHVIDLEYEAGIKNQTPDINLIPKKILPVMQAERDCKSWIQWMEGFTPQEHRQMEFEEKVRQSDKRWHIAEIILIVLLSGLFTLLGSWLSRGQPPVVNITATPNVTVQQK